MDVINAKRSLAYMHNSRLARSYTSMPLVGRHNRTNATSNGEFTRLLSFGRSSGQGRQPIRGQRPKDPRPKAGVCSNGPTARSLRSDSRAFSARAAAKAAASIAIASGGGGAVLAVETPGPFDIAVLSPPAFLPAAVVPTPAPPSLLPASCGFISGGGCPPGARC
jgi:hypothetical protein